ncbi:MAG: Bona fide RidA/YjgF/TdcF/RutC subgroup [Pseudomonas sp.]|nr:Bona fide RidA/YjgF/TdcF/RutC subgroup [Pseudomonas sp.]
MKGLLAVAAMPAIALLSRKSLAAQGQVPRKSILNPWRWQDKHGFVQGRVISSSSTLIFCAGQASLDADGNPLHKNDMAAQMAKSLENLQAVLAEGGATLSNVVRVTYYVTDMDLFFAAMETLTSTFERHSCKPTSTLIGVATLFHTDLLFEVEAIAALPAN